MGQERERGEEKKTQREFKRLLWGFAELVSGFFNQLQGEEGEPCTMRFPPVAGTPLPGGGG